MGTCPCRRPPAVPRLQWAAAAGLAQPVASATAGENLALATADENPVAAARAAGRWRRLVTATRRLRRLQRLWGLLGNFLRGYPQELRDKLREPLPPARLR